MICFIAGVAVGVLAYHWFVFVLSFYDRPEPRVHVESNGSRMAERCKNDL